MSIAAPNNDEERARAKIFDQAYDLGWCDALDAAAEAIAKNPVYGHHTSISAILALKNDLRT